jgi:hypothetical protein
MTDFRALCAELLQELEHATNWDYQQALKDQARVYLSQPDPEGPTAAELSNRCEWIPKATPWDAEKLRAARRPKPPSLKQQALEELAWVDKNLKGNFFHRCNAIHTIRQALESIPDPN